jgi:hypothetical protein
MTKRRKRAHDSVGSPLYTTLPEFRPACAPASTLLSAAVERLERLCGAPCPFLQRLINPFFAHARTPSMQGRLNGCIIVDTAEAHFLSSKQTCRKKREGQGRVSDGGHDVDKGPAGHSRPVLRKDGRCRRSRRRTLHQTGAACGVHALTRRSHPAVQS